MKLTHKNYFTNKNTSISNSKLNDFRKSKNYFYRKHIEHSQERGKMTIPMKVGSLVDDIVSGAPTAYEMKVLSQDDRALFLEQKEMDEDTLLPKGKYNEALAHADNIMSSSAYKTYRWHHKRVHFQFILQGEYLLPTGDKLPLCGIADVISRRSKVIYIDDFKVVGYNKAYTKQKWFWICHDMGYFRQLAYYRMLYRMMFPDDKRKIVCRHFISSKVPFADDLYKVFLYTIDDSILFLAKTEIQETLNNLSVAIETDDWSDPDTKWEDAEHLSYEYQNRQAARVDTSTDDDSEEAEESA